VIACIIGSGFAGLAASDLLRRSGVDAMVYEARDHWGGHTHSITEDGFTFDEGPHVSFTKDEAVQVVFAKGAGGYEEISARITNYFHGQWLPHPVQCHLYGLPAELVTACLVDFIAAQQEPPTINTYRDWCHASFGKTLAETFPLVYTRKYWTVDASDMGVDWVGQRMYPPKLDEVIRGALEPANEGDFHYLTHARYPTEGGYQSFMGALYRDDMVELSKPVVRVDPAGRALTFADGTRVDYQQLISTMPLPELIAAIDPEVVPDEVKNAADLLLCSSLVLVDVAVKRADLSNHEWFYVYDDDISISRGHFPHMLSPNNAPVGKGSIQLEVYHSRHRPLPCPPDELPDRVVDELVRMGVLTKDDVLWTRFREVKYANVVFDSKRADALATILPWIQGQGIFLAGRYGEWGYHWTDDATRSGWTAAQAVLDALGAPAAAVSQEA
jgi:protoporphyrinogen oxidase